MWDDAKALRNLANGLFALCFLLLLVGALHFLAHLPVFVFRSARLAEAPQRVSAMQVEYVVRNELRGNFFTADLGHLRESLEKLPWVRNASLRRTFPWQLEITLEEHQAVAHWNQNELVNRQGEVFAAECDDDDMPNYFGQPGTAPEVMRKYAEFGEQLEPLQQDIVQISLSPRHDWRLKMAGGLVLELGLEQVEQRLARFVSVYHYSLGALPRPTSYVDLRYSNGFAAYVPGGTGKSAGQTAAGKV